jgi:short-subunit dehydrogenase
MEKPMATALITGGGGAIAFEIATRLQDRGYDLILVDFDQRRMEENASKLKSPKLVKIDLSNAVELEALSQQIERGDLDVDLLVNNAGFIRPGTIADADPDIVTRQISINLVAPIRLTQAAVRYLIMRQKPGGVLSLISAAGMVSLPGNAAYSASKFGLRGFLLGASLELADKGITFTQIFPGAVDTPMLRYEATHGGSPMNFLNKDVLTAAQVADVSVSAYEKKTLEAFLPRSEGWMGRLLVAFPGLLKFLLPHLEKRGEKNRAHFVATRGLSQGAE